MREPLLKELQGAARLTRGFFNSLIRRIECTKPIAGSGVLMAQKDDGIMISLGTDVGDEGLQVYELTICKDGEPTILKLYGPSNQ